MINWCDLVQSGRSKVVITNVKITILIVINHHQPNLIATFPSPINEDMHVCTKNNIYKFVGVVWGYPLEAEEILKT